MILKVSGKNKKSECVHIKSSNGNMCYSTKEISNALGGNFQKTLFQFQLQSTISGYKNGKRKKKSELSVTKQRKIYNLPFKLSELKNSLDKSNDTTAGPDDIHYQILKHLPSDAFETLLNIMNEIWRTGRFPEDWHKAVIIPIPKPGKDKTEATNYRLAVYVKQWREWLTIGRVVLGWAYRGLTGGFLLLQNFSVAISVSPHVCFILVLILISMFLR